MNDIEPNPTRHATSTMQPGRAPERRTIFWGLLVVAVAAGGLAGYGFGSRLGGLPFGLLTAGLTALFCSILFDAAAARIGRRE